jgi:hypothetical protein
MLDLIQAIAEVYFFKENILNGSSLLGKEIVIQSAVLFVSFTQCIFYFSIFATQFLYFCP